MVFALVSGVLSGSSMSASCVLRIVSLARSSSAFLGSLMGEGGGGLVVGGGCGFGGSSCGFLVGCGCDGGFEVLSSS